MTERPVSGEIMQKRILWRCRRGMRELDLLLIPFAEEKYCHLSVNQQRTFQKLLNYPDTTLYSLLNGSIVSTDRENRTIIQMIRDFA